MDVEMEGLPVAEAGSHYRRSVGASFLQQFLVNILKRMLGISARFDTMASRYG
jgi:hypothetical protein